MPKEVIDPKLGLCLVSYQFIDKNLWISLCFLNYLILFADLPRASSVNV